MSSYVSITPYDIAIHKQHRQRRHTMIKVLNREFGIIHTIQGRLISGNIDIDATSNIRRTGNISLKIKKSDIIKVSDFSMDNYLRIYCGTENNNTREVSWYLQGTFIINQNGFNFDKTSRILSLSLSDLMLDLTGDRAGTLHAYSSVAKNSQRIDSMMTNVLELCGVKNTDITPICVLRKQQDWWKDGEKEEDYMIPHDLEFSVGVTGYEILDKLCTLYPYWEIFFNPEGTFVCQQLTTEEDTSFVVLEDRDLRHFVISENTNVDYSQVKNLVEVWGKDGHYYGESKDETPDSPFNINAHKTMRVVYSGGNYDNIYDRYKDVKLQDTLLSDKEKYEKEIADLTDTIQKCNKTAKGFEKIIDDPKSTTKDKIAATAGLIAVNASIDDYKSKKKLASQNLKQTNSKISSNIDIKGDDMAKQWADQLLYENCRLKDSITIETIHLPFLNDVNCKISYRSKVDDLVRTYIVKNISHNLDANTTTINAVRFYAENCSAYMTPLDIPKIEGVNVDGMIITIKSSEVRFAESYSLYIDGKLSATSTGTTLTFELPEEYSGEHDVFIAATAEGFRSSFSEHLTLEFSSGTFLITSNGDFIITSGGDNIEIIEGE